jgi:cardiolipin synthase A/B
MKLILQPNDGAGPLIKAIKRAKTSVEIVIFRFDDATMERALIEAAERGVCVHALIAFTNRGGEKNLRQLEMRFLAKGITVARSANDLVRYHGKIMLVDRKELFVLAYNFTRVDMEQSRSFAIATKNPKLVQEAAQLFECDTKRQTYKAQTAKLIVSPANARQRLAAFIKGAKRELKIYDPKLSDKEMLRLLEERRHAGIKIRIIGQIGRSKHVTARPLRGLRLHARVIIRDGKEAFIGSQSLRRVELDERREIGIMVGAAKVVNALTRVFEDDWKATKPRTVQRKPRAMSNGGEVKAMAKAVAKQLPVAPVVRQVAEVIHKAADVEIDRKEVKETVEQAVKSALKKAVKKATAEVVESAEKIG